MEKTTKMNLMATLQRMADREELIIFDEISKQLWAIDEIQICMNGPAIQISVKDNLTLSERIIKYEGDYMIGFDFTFENDDVKVCVINVTDYGNKLEYEYYITDINNNELKDYYVSTDLEDEIFNKCKEELRKLKDEEKLIDYERRCLNV